MNGLTASAILLTAMGLAQNNAVLDEDGDNQPPAPNQNVAGPAGAPRPAARPDPNDPNAIHVHHHFHHWQHNGPPPSNYLNVPPPSDPSLTPYPRVGGYGGGGYGRGYGGGWGGGYGGGTIAGNYLQGLGAAAAGMGQYNLATAEAGRQVEGTRAAYLQNQMSALNDYFMAHEANRQYREAKYIPALSDEQIYEANKARLPKRLRLDQFDPVTGKVNWPDVLKSPELAADREQLDKLFADRTHENSGVGSENFHDVQMVVHDMMLKLHDEIKTLSPAEYLLALNFIDGLGFESRFPPSTVPGATAPGAQATPGSPPAGPAAAQKVSQQSRQ